MRGAVLALSAIALSAGPAFAQTLAQGAASPTPWWRIFAALLLCLLLAVGAAIAIHFRATGRLPNLKSARLALPVARGGALQSLFRTPAARRLKAIETIRVSPYADVCLFVCDGKTYLIAATPQGVTVIEHDREASAEGAGS